MSAAFAQAKALITDFSLEEQLSLLTFLANSIKQSSIKGGISEQTGAKTVIRQPGLLKGQIWTAPDFDETPDCFKDYV